jgi:hypothetical protein
MMSDPLAFATSKQDRAAIDLDGSGPLPSAISPREAAQHALRLYDRMFFLRVAQTNRAQASLLKTSAITLAESQKLLADVSNLLRR